MRFVLRPLGHIGGDRSLSIRYGLIAKIRESAMPLLLEKNRLLLDPRIY